MSICEEGALQAPPIMGTYAVFTSTEHCAPSVRARSPEEALALAVSTGALGVARSGLAWIRRAGDANGPAHTIALPWQVALVLPTRGLGQSWPLGPAAPVLPDESTRRQIAAIVSALPLDVLLMVDWQTETVRVRRPDASRFITTTVASIRPRSVTWHASTDPSLTAAINLAAGVSVAETSTLTSVG